MLFKSRVVPGLLALALGFGCLNYTNAFDVEHHHEWAEESGFPPPSETIFFVGIGSLALGGVLIGNGLVRRRGSSA